MNWIVHSNFFRSNTLKSMGYLVDKDGLKPHTDQLFLFLDVESLREVQSTAFISWFPTVLFTIHPKFFLNSKACIWSTIFRCVSLVWITWTDYAFYSGLFQNKLSMSSCSFLKYSTFITDDSHTSIGADLGEDYYPVKQRGRFTSAYCYWTELIENNGKI